jgi:AcrR family transcriptional regulator
VFIEAMEKRCDSDVQPNSLFGEADFGYARANMELKRRAKFRSNDPEGMRARILDAAAELFQARGYHDTSVQHVKSAAAVSSGAFHHHFESKKALGLAVIKERVSEALQVAWLDPLIAGPTLADGIDSVIGTMSGGLREQGFVRGCPVNNLALELSFSDSDFRGALQSIFDGWRATIVQRLDDENLPEILGEVSADDMATFVIAAYSGAMTMSKAKQSPEPLVTTFDILLKLLKSQKWQQH